MGLARVLSRRPEWALRAAWPGGTGRESRLYSQRTRRAHLSLGRDVADVDHYPVRAGQRRDVIRPPGGQAEAEAQVALEVARRRGREQPGIARSQHVRPGPGPVGRLRAEPAGPAEDDMQEGMTGQGTLSSLRSEEHTSELQ